MIDYIFLYLVKSLLLSIVWIAAWVMFLLFLRRVKAETRYFIILLIFAMIPLLPFITSDYLPAHGSGIYSRFELFKTVKLDNYMSVGGISQIEINPGKTDLTFESQPGDEGNLSEKPEPEGAGFKEVMILIWAVVFSLLFLKIGAGLFLLGRISAGSIEAGSGELRQVVLRSAEKLGLQRLPDVRVSGIIATPVSFGIIHPVIILPEFIVSEMSGEDIEQIIIHEMAHIRRGDYPVVLFQRLMECVFFYNPAVWFLGLRLSMLREECCDSIVVEMASDRAKYAANILAVAGRGLKPGLQVANGITGRGGLFRRIEKIMEDGDNYKDMGVRKKIILAVCGSVAGLLLVMCANSSVREIAADSPYSGLPVEISSIMEEMEKYNKSCLTDTYLIQNEIRLNYVERAISKASQLSDAHLRKESLLKLNMMKAAIISDPERSAVIYREQIAAARELGEKGIEGECLLKLGHHNLSFGAGNRRENEKMISEAEILLTGAGRNDILSDAYFFRMANFLEEKKYGEAVKISSDLVSAVKKSSHMGAGQDAVASAVEGLAGKIKGFSADDELILYCSTAEIFSGGKSGVLSYTGQPGYGGSFVMTDREMDLFDYPLFWSLGNSGGIAFEWIKEGNSQTVKSFSFGREPLKSIIKCVSEKEEVKVPAGIFRNCRHISVTVTGTAASDREEKKTGRVKLLNGILKGKTDVWYAPGTGIVKVSRERRGAASSLLLAGFRISSGDSSSPLPLIKGNTWRYSVAAPGAEGYRAEYVARVEETDGAISYLSYYGYAVKMRGDVSTGRL